MVNDRIFDTVARDAASAVSRRRSFLAIGGAALTAAATLPTTAQVDASRKSSLKRCKKQTGQCHAAITEYCAPLEEPQVCEAFLGSCCDELAQCSAGLAITCLLATVAS